MNCRPSSRTVPLLAAGSLILVAGAGAQEDTSDVAPEIVREQTSEWVQTRRLISQERAAWTEEKGTLQSLNELRQREITQLKEFAEAATTRVEDIATKRTEFAAEETELISQRKQIDTRITRFERQLRELLPRFPRPLREKVEESASRLETAAIDRPLQDRTRDVLLILQAWLDFDNTITVDRDLHEIDGSERELTVLYLGADQAWYVDETGDYAGIGTPTPTGWTWAPQDQLADSISEAIQIQQKEIPPTFVTLPFRNGADLPK